MNKKRKNVRNWIILLLVILLGAGGAAIVGRDVGQPQPVLTQALAETTENGSEVFTMDFSNEPENVIYLAGGCFWGIEHLMASIPGVIDAESGYANGRNPEDANYQTICSGDTGFRETVRVEYDPGQVSLASSVFVATKTYLLVGAAPPSPFALDCAALSAECDFLPSTLNFYLDKWYK